MWEGGFGGCDSHGRRAVEKRHSPPAGVLAEHVGKFLHGKLAAALAKSTFPFHAVASDIAVILPNALKLGQVH